MFILRTPLGVGVSPFLNQYTILPLQLVVVRNNSVSRLFFVVLGQDGGRSKVYNIVEFAQKSAEFAQKSGI